MNSYTMVVASGSYVITASRLVSLLKILGALVVDYSTNPDAPMSKDLQPLMKSGVSEWKMLPSLQVAIRSAVSGKDKVSALYDLGVEIKTAFLEHFHKTLDFTSDELQMLRAVRSYLMTDSEPALAFIRKKASLFDEPALALAFAPPMPKVNNTELSRVVRTAVGRDGVALSPEEAGILKDTKPALYQKYADLRKAHNSEFKATLMNYVRTQGRKLVDYQAAYAALTKLGFTHSMVPGFTGLIDDEGKWYTKDGELIAGVPNLATYSKVIMNNGRDPDTKFVFYAVKPDGSMQQTYTVQHNTEQSKLKYEHVRELSANLKAIRARWLAKIKKFDVGDIDCVAAVVLEILYTFAARVGSDPGRGVGTLLVKNSSITQNGINLAYLGKDSIPTKHIIKTTDPIQKQIVAALTELLEGKRPSEFIFTHWDGKKWLRCKPSDINAAFRRFGASQDVTVHKLRTFRGTTLFKQLIEEQATKRPPKDEKEALAIYTTMTEKVGKLLNHKRGVGGDNEKVTGTTAAKSYIDADLQISLFRSWGFRVPKSLEKLAQATGD